MAVKTSNATVVSMRAQGLQPSPGGPHLELLEGMGAAKNHSWARTGVLGRFKHVHGALQCV